MTIKQYQKLAKTIADKITELSGDPNYARNIECSTEVIITVRDPKKYGDAPVGMTSGNGNTTLSFNTLSNPNNPNYKYKTLKPGSMSAYNSQTGVNVDITDYNFDSAQFSSLLNAIANGNWTLLR